MQQLDLLAGPAEFAGAAAVRPARGGGVTIFRVPPAHRHLFGPMMALMVRTPSGVRMRFRTDSTSLVVRMDAQRVARPDGAVSPLRIDVVVDGADPVSVDGDGGTVLRADMSTDPPTFETLGTGPARFALDLPGRPVDIEVWLPHNASGALLEVAVDDGATVDAPTPDPRPRWVHYGSSISQCAEAHSPTRTWPALAARLGGWNLVNLGLGGSCHLDQFVARQIRDLPADRISCKVGVNIVGGGTFTQRTFKPALHAFLDTIRDGHPDTPLVVISPIWCPYLEDHPGPGVSVDGVLQPGPPSALADSLTVRWVRDYMAEAVAFRRDGGDTNLSYLDGLDLFSEADDADLPDNLHPNADGYLRMGERWHTLVDAAG